MAAEGRAMMTLLVRLINRTALPAAKIVYYAAALIFPLALLLFYLAPLWLAWLFVRRSGR